MQRYIAPILLLGLAAYACKKEEKNSSKLAAISSASEIVAGTYTIRSIHSNRCLDVPRSSSENSVVLWQYACNGTKAQLWKITKVDDRFVTITNVGSGKALDIREWSLADGARLVQFTLGSNQANQQFAIEGTEGRMAIRSRHSGKVLDVVENGTSDSVEIQQWTDYQTPNQRWSLTLVESEKNVPGPQVPVPDPDPTPKPQDPSGNDVKVAGRQLLIGGQAFSIKSVCYNPVRKGQAHPAGLAFNNPSQADLELLDRDFRMMREAGINTIRTYEAILDDRVLNLVSKHQLRMIVPALNYYQMSPARVTDIVNKLKNHPATLIWEMGNEWNYNHLYGAETGFSFDAAKKMIKDTAALVKSLDKSHPTATVYGELPPKDLVNEFGDIDIWGLNVYSGLSFGDRFARWKALSTKPMYFGEFGADAINVRSIDLEAQAKADFSLANEIAQNLAAKNPENATLGGSVFEWNDEWWKDGKGSPQSQDVGGIAPGGGPFPDSVFNEEYWGIVDIDRNPRPAYFKLKEAFSRF